MFTIKADNTTIWTPNDTDKRLMSPNISLEVNKVGSVNFKVLPGHKYYDELVKMKTIITVLQGSRTIFKGRVFSDAEDFRGVKSISAEGILGYFNDSIVRPYEFSGSVADYLDFLITQHNNQVEDHQRFLLGNVTVVDDNDYITRASSDYGNTWNEINKKLIENLGGYIVIRYENNGNYIDYLSDYTDTSTQSIAFAVNLLDINLESKAENLATCIIPYGAKDETTGEKIDITSVNNGVDYIYDAEAVAKYGKIFEVVNWDNVTVPANLLKKAQLYLSNKIKLTTKITVRAIDLHLSDATIEAFKLGDYVKVYSKPHGIDEVILLTAYNMSLDNPANCTITLGIEKSSYVRSVNATNINRTDVIKKEVENSFTQESNKILSQTQNYVNQEIESSEEYSRSLLQEYVTTSEFSSTKEAISSEFTHTAESVALSFTTINERISKENGEIVANLEEISKYIRFIDGNIILGEVGNDLTTKIANGRISFLYNDSMEVAYISDNKLYITQAEVLDRIVIGKYAFIPRANGNLSFKTV